MTRCRKQGTCRHCNKPILNGEYMIKGKLWLKRGPDGPEARRWTVHLLWHPNCWMEQAKAAVDSKGYVETRGRPFDKRTDEDRKARNKILARRARTVQRIREVAKMEDTEARTDKLIHLGGILLELEEEIKEYGGAPKSWGV